jgi:hypothetical protein
MPAAVSSAPAADPAADRAADTGPLTAPDAAIAGGPVAGRRRGAGRRRDRRRDRRAWPVHARILYGLQLALLVAGPSVIASAVSEIRKDPFLRWMSIDEAALAETEVWVRSSEPYLRARIYWRGPAGSFVTPDDLSDAVRGAFHGQGVEAHIAVLKATGPGPTTLDFRTGVNRFGPFPVAEAARYVKPAAEAARLAHGNGEVARPHRW